MHRTIWAVSSAGNQRGDSAAWAAARADYDALLYSRASERTSRLPLFAAAAILPMRAAEVWRRVWGALEIGRRAQGHTVRERSRYGRQREVGRVDADITCRRRAGTYRQIKAATAALVPCVAQGTRNLQLAVDPSGVDGGAASASGLYEKTKMYNDRFEPTPLSESIAGRRLPKTRATDLAGKSATVARKAGLWGFQPQERRLVTSPS